MPFVVCQLGSACSETKFPISCDQAASFCPSTLGCAACVITGVLAPATVLVLRVQAQQAALVIATLRRSISCCNESRTGSLSFLADIAGTSSEGAWGSANSGSGWNYYRQGKKKAAAEAGLMGKSPGTDAGRRARRNAKKAAADAKADVYAY